MRILWVRLGLRGSAHHGMFGSTCTYFDGRSEEWDDVLQYVVWRVVWGSFEWGVVGYGGGEELDRHGVRVGWVRRHRRGVLDEELVVANTGEEGRGGYEWGH